HVRGEDTDHFRTLLENSLDLIIVLSTDGLIQYTSRSSERMLGYPSDTLSGESIFTYVHEEDADALRDTLAQTFAQPGISDTIKFRLRSATEEWHVLEASSITLPEEGQPLRAIINARDVTEHEAQSAALKHQSLHDALTGLPNRALFNESFTDALRLAQEKGRRLTLLYIDLDRFREINDTFGYRWGDVILQQVAPRLQGALRKSDTLGRLNGDEFAVLLPSVGDMAGATRLARRMLQVLEAPFLVEGHKVTVGASIGVVFFPDYGTDVDTLMRRADMTMHLAKEAGSGYAFYTQEQEDRYNPNRLVLISDLRQAIEQEQLLLYYQPKADISSKAVSQVEALIRWRHPQQGLIPPDRFIPLAEQTGLIRSISRWTLNEGIRHCHM